MRLFEDPNFEFIKNRKVGYVISTVLLVLSIGTILFKGLSYGIDFNGGTEFVVEFERDASVADVRSLLTTTLGSQPEVKQFGLSRDLLIRTDVEMEISALQRTVLGALNEAFADNPSVIIKSDVVGPRFAEDLKRGAMMAVIFSLVVIFLYILIRFRNFGYSVGTVGAITHDVIIILGMFTLLNEIMPFSLDIDQTIIAAFLTIVGYSLNDTVVVFDRIRENSLIYKTMGYEEMVNKSINNTLSRTVITSLTTLFVVVVLFIFGGEVLKGFAFALMIGIILGTYSTLYVACPLLVDLKSKGVAVKK
ncbi:MAG: protein translocase subunit SecF [Bacteroidetes bacterium]|nr:protein translocase subunit SecF [Bacteroidota bacterium]MCH8523790.1 protein translocase subunit SecF [Balneolales bacterium]